MTGMLDLVGRLLKRKPQASYIRPMLPLGVRIYAIGDIHGRADLLECMHQAILEDSADMPSEIRKVVVYLGDYIDRGHQSREVIDLLLKQPLEGFERVHLKGNHEDILLQFLSDPSIGREWFALGGNATVLSYGIRIPDHSSRRRRFRHIWHELNISIPEEHLAFFRDLRHLYEVGNCIFVHAGINPERPLDKQKPDDLFWIREEFLSSDADFGRVVIHGHAPRSRPVIGRSRIGIDTAAYATGRLTCLVLERMTRRFLST